MGRNLIVILSDEHRSDVMGCANHPFIQTPHLDRLAASGTRFTNAYTPPYLRARKSSLCLWAICASNITLG